MQSRFPSKSVLVSEKVGYKISLCENCQRQSHKAFTGLSMQKWLVADVYLYRWKNADLQSIFSHSASAVT